MFLFVRSIWQQILNRRTLRDPEFAIAVRVFRVLHLGRICAWGPVVPRKAEFEPSRVRYVPGRYGKIDCVRDLDIATVVYAGRRLRVGHLPGRGKSGLPPCTRFQDRAGSQRTRS